MENRKKKDNLPKNGNTKSNNKTSKGFQAMGKYYKALNLAFNNFNFKT
jgi:hypothetical protein